MPRLAIKASMFEARVRTKCTILHGMQVEFSSADENENELSAANGGRRNKFQVINLLTLRKFLVWKDDC